MNTEVLSRAWGYARFVASLAGAYFCRFVGGMDALVRALIALSALDYMSGVLVALIQKRLSSAVGFKGIAKKALVFVIVGASSLTDSHVLGAGGALRGAVIGFYIANEALSLSENAALLGLPVPQRLKQALEQLKDKGNR